MSETILSERRAPRTAVSRTPLSIVRLSAPASLSHDLSLAAFTINIDPHSDLAGVLSLAAKAKRPLNASDLEVGYIKLVAGTCNHLNLLFQAVA